MKMYPKLKTSLILLLLAIVTLSSSGCGFFAGNSIPPGPGGRIPAVWMTLSLSKAPKLGETTEVTITANAEYIPANISAESLTKSRVWVEVTWADIYGSYFEAEYAVPVPLEEVLVGGNLTWDGALEVRKPLEVRSRISLPREGVWSITAYFIGEGWQKPLTDEVRVATTKNVAAIMGTKEHLTGPLSYLRYFGYGQGGKFKPQQFVYEAVPVFMYLDLSKAPKLREEAILSCSIYSLYDLSNFPVQITFRKRINRNEEKGVPGDKLLVGGSLSWTGNLTKDAPAQFSATIKFPEEGDWWIHAQANYPINGQPGFADILTLRVSRKISYFDTLTWQQVNWK